MEMSGAETDLLHVEEGHLLSDWASVWSADGGWCEQTRTYNPVEALDRAFEERPVVNIKGALFVGYNNSYFNYYHMLLEWLPAIWEFSCLPYSPDLWLVLPRAAHKSVPLSTLVEGLGLQDRVKWVETHPPAATLRSDVVIHSRYLSSMRNYEYSGAAVACHDYLSSLVSPRRAPANLPSAVNVGRSDSPKRRLVNRPQLEDMLRREWRIPTVTLSGASFRYQAALFMSATCVIGDHGAGLANLAFKGGPRSVIEIRPMTYPNPCFKAIADGRGDHYSLVDSHLHRAGEDWHQSDYEVDLDCVHEALRGLLSS